MLGLIQNGVEAYTPHTLKRTHVQVRAYIHHAAVMCTLYIHHLHMPVTTCSWYGMFDWIWIFRVVRSLLMVSCICRKNTRRNSIDFISLCESGCEWNANQMAIFRYLHFRLADIVFTLQNTKKRNRKCKRRTLKLMDFGDCVLFDAKQIHFSAQISCEGNVLYSNGGNTRTQHLKVFSQNHVAKSFVLWMQDLLWCCLLMYCTCDIKCVSEYDHFFT